MQVRPLMAENEKRDVAFELHPALGMLHGKRVQLGYDITLYGAHDGPHEMKDGEPVCPRCQAVWDDLRAIATELIAQAGTDEGIYRVEPFRPGVSISTKRKGADGQSREEVEFVLEVRRNAPITDAAEQVDREQMIQPLIDSLRGMGLHEGA